MFSSFYPAIELFPQPGLGTVVETITTTQRGRVWFSASYWPARLHGITEPVRLLPDESVLVIGREGIFLLIQPNPIEVTVCARGEQTD